MRIIAGELGGRRIAALPGKGTRPMLDRVREALFSSLGARVVDAGVLDLFAGSGGLGLEALSRGARSVRQVEADRRAAEVLRKTLDELGVSERVELVTGDALAPGNWGSPETDSLDLVFLDPPYRMVSEARERKNVFGAIEELFGEWLSADGMAVLHTPRGAVLERDFPGATAARVRQYGTNDLWYLEREVAE